MTPLFFSFICFALILGGGCASTDVTRGNRTRNELLEARARVAAKMKMVAYKRVFDVVTKQRNQQGRLVAAGKIDHVDLRFAVLEPPLQQTDPGKNDPRPAVLFFHGGGFRSGTPAQFFLQAEYFAKRGIVAFCVEYRVKNKFEVTIAQQLADARSAIQWVRINAADFNVDPHQVIAAGGSAGGYLSLASAVLPHSNPETVPNAVVLFNPAIDFAIFAASRGKAQLEASLGGSIEQYSCTPHLRPGLPPIIIFQGEDDETTPLAGAKMFTDRALTYGLTCELVTFPGVGHGFLNRDPYLENCSRQALQFLHDQGFSLRED